MTAKHWFGHYVVEIEGFMPRERCEALVAHAESIGFDEATINTSAGHVLDKDVRNNDRVISDDTELASELWSLARSHVSVTFKQRTVVGLNRAASLLPLRSGPEIRLAPGRLLRARQRRAQPVHLHGLPQRWL